MKKIIAFLLLTAILAMMLTGCGFTTPRPEITSGEFSFSVTYEFNGEIKTISGIYVCEYDGVDWVLDGGFHREWKGYIKDNTTEDVIRLATAEDGGEIDLNLGFDPSHFMGDSHWGNEEPFTPMLTVKLVGEVGLYFESDSDIIAETYGAKIISYEYDESIENRFN